MKTTTKTKPTGADAYMALVYEEVYKKVSSLVDKEFEAKKQQLEDEKKQFQAEIDAAREYIVAGARKLNDEIEESADSEYEKRINLFLNRADEIEARMEIALSDLETTKSDVLTAIQPAVTEMLNTVDKAVAEMSTKTGPQGPKGNDGSPDTAKQILKKLKKTGIPVSLINGLEQEIKNLRRSIRGGNKAGGGMGNLQHESKNVNSSTTSITTTYPIAANGAAIWAYYQGQLIVRGTHYTVSGKTLTLTFTPDDGTVIDIQYVRGS